MKRPFIWIVLGLLCLASGWWAWQRPAKLPVKPSAPARVVATPTARTVHSAAAVPGVLTPAYTNLVKGGMTSTNPFDYRLSNTAKPLGELVRDAHAILLENALIDTGSPLNISLPQTLQSQGDPGAYIVQARGPIDGAFRAMLAAAGAQVVSYMPNDAYLVRAQAGVANALAANSKVQAVLSYEPYYKIQMPLLVLAMQDRKLPPGMTLTLGLYSDTAPQTIRQIENSGGTVFGQVKTPIGTIVDVMPPRDWLTVATLPGTKNVEIGRVARPANDISRSTVAVAQDPQVITNYLNLSGSNVLVEMNDSGVDALHPDFNTAGGVLRILGNSPLSFVDTNGHGTHVAGTIAGDGTESLTVTNAQGSIMPPMTNQFRGMAPLAKLYSVAAIDPTFGFLLTSDKNLQEIPALTNALISNNSWNYGGDAIYDLHAASFDAAVRDALSERTGSQPVLFVFSAGNDGGGGTDGTGGTPDSILSPATAKNVVTVGALEEERGITNIVTDRGSNMIPFWETRTDNGVEVTEFSSRGNVGVDIEGTFGRYKPDVVAPGSFVVSTRSSQWNEQAYYNPTNYIFTVRTNQLVNTNSLHSYSISVPANAVGVNISFVRNSRSALPFPTNLPVYVRKADFPAPTNFDILTFKDGVSIPPDSGGNITDITSIQNSGFFYGIGNTNSVPIYYDLVTEVITTNDNGNYFLVLSNLNNSLGGDADSTVPPHYYRYESGTSMAAATVSGVLALIEDYFTNTLAATPSPAMLKAMLINGARPDGNYKFQVQNSINFAGWGLVNLPNVLPPGLTTNVSKPDGESMLIIDQSPTNGLATGDSHTYQLSIVPDSDGQFQALRVTLAWTDPPGDPAAAIKLVNNLDLVITNLDDPANPIIYYGNDIPKGSTVNSQNTTNAPNLDFINNVENVFIPFVLGTNYSITVIGRNVNVNAVTAHTNNVVQDFAMVISCGEGEVTNAFTVTDLGIARNPTTDQLITVVTVTNTPLLNQIVGASTPLLGTNSIGIGTNTTWGNNGMVVLGMTNQWHFYIITNNGPASDFTNAAFITFIPSTLSIPRTGVYANSTEDATRPEADIDLYATTDPGLTNLDPVVIANCLAGVGNNRAAVGRGGTEFAAYTNSAPGVVYYVGVYAEDRMASEYGFIPIFTDVPFSQPGPNGSTIFPALSVPVNIPDGSTVHPGISYVFALAINSMPVKRVTVTETIAHENFGDLITTFTHGNRNGQSKAVVLNNHDSEHNPAGIYTDIFDDSGQGDIPGARSSDGPGTLSTFAGQDALGPWMLTAVDLALTATGSVTGLSVRVDPHHDLSKGVTVTLGPNTWFVDFIEVPVGFQSLTVSATNTSVEATPSVPVGSIPIAFYERFNAAPTFTDFDQFTGLINSFTGIPFPGGADPGNSLSTGPPLPAGLYWIGLYNSNSTPQSVFVTADLIPAPVSNTFSTNGAAVGISDDAVTSSTIFINNTNQISSVNVGLIVTNARISDLTFTLISPAGQRILLMENRGGTTATNLGHLIVTTNYFGTTTAGGATASTNVLVPVATSGILLIDYDFFTVPDQLQVYYSGILIFDSGLIPGSGQFPIPYGPPNTPGIDNKLVIVMNQNNNTNNPTTAWEYTPTVVQLDYDYLTFTENTNLTDMPIKFAIPPYDLGHNATNTIVSDFEQTTNGNYFAFTNIFDGFGGWTLPTNLVTYTVSPTNASVLVTNVVVLTNNEVSVVTDPINVRGGSNYLALAQGVMTRTIPVTVGRKYSLTYGYRGPGIAGWWRGEGNATDGSDPESTGNNGSLIGQFNFPAGEVGQAFQMEAVGQPYDFAGTNNYVQIRQPPVLRQVNTNNAESGTNLVPFSGLDVGTGSGFTVEGWINPTSAIIAQPLVEWLARVPTNGADTNLAIEAGPFLDRDTGHYYYLLSRTNWTTSELWATQLGGHLVTLDTANEQNWVYDTFSRYGQLHRNLWIGLNDAATPGTFVWSSGLTNVVYTNWVAGGYIPCNPNDHYATILGPTNAFPGLWVLENNNGTNNNGVTCGVAATNFTYGVVEVNEIQTNGVRFWISVTNSPGTTNLLVSSNGCLYANIVDTTNGFHEIYSAPGFIQTNIFQHVALTYDTNTGTARLYYNGTNVATTNWGGGFTPKTTGDLLVGKDMSRLTNNYFTGRMDEMSVYKRFLSDAEIAAIYFISASTSNRNIGKFDPSVTPAFGLAEARVSLSTVGTNLVFGANTNWQTQGFTFTATTNMVELQIAGLEPGLLLDSFSLSEAEVGNLYYLPEISLDALNGERAFGTWTLEIWDNRTGGLLSGGSLVSWQLQFTMATNVPITLSANDAVTNTVPPGGITYYVIDVPIWATSANNILVSASQPVDLLFNQNTPPSGNGAGDFTFLTASTGGNRLMNIAGVPPPPLLPGQTYYLGVHNPNTHSATVVVEVDFDMIVLTNGIPFSDTLSTNFTDVERYFAFDVSSNATEATFQLLQLSGNADLVVRKGAPLPTLLSSDYGSFNTANVDENIYVLTNSSPVPLSAGRWYLGVFRRDPGPVHFAVLAKELDPQVGPPLVPNIIDLTNNVPFTWTAGPGAALTNFFRFTVTNAPPAIHFELFNMSGNGDLTVQTNAPPLAPPFFQSSQQPGVNPEWIFISTNTGLSGLTNRALTNLNAQWYLGVPNHETNRITYTILAVLDTNMFFPTFPGAQGAGGGTLGGRGGDVFHVINLNDDGPGSLRYGITSFIGTGSTNDPGTGTTNLSGSTTNISGGRTIVFDVSGTINLLSPLVITNSYLTIAGQTAPGGGITVAGQLTTVASAHDVAIRYLRFRPVTMIPVTTNAAVSWHNSFEGSLTINPLGAGSYFAGGWHVDSGDIDVIAPPSYSTNSTGDEGTNWIDMDGFNPGTISTNIATVPGKNYTLTFTYAQNADGKLFGHPTALLQALQNGNPLLSLSVTQTNGWLNLGWSTTSVVFTATSNLTKLAFQSLDPAGDWYGVLLDCIDLTSSDLNDGFEKMTAGDYVRAASGPGFNPGFGGWTVLTNQVTVISNASLAYTGTNLLALADGQIARVLPTVAGNTYILSFAYRGPGMMSLWRGETNANDSINGNNPGTANNITFTNGLVGKAFALNGTSSYVNVPDSPLLDSFSNVITVDTWMKTSVAGSSSEWRGLLTKGNNSWRLMVSQFALTEYIAFNNASPGDLTGTKNISDGNWHHVAAVYDGRWEYLYVDGALDLSQAATGVLAVNPFALCIGANADIPSGGLGYFFNGLLDEPGIYTRALSPSEIKAIYKHGALGKYDTNAPSIARGLAESRLTLNGIAQPVFYGNNTNWQIATIQFTATGTNTPLVIAGLEPGMLLDAFTLTSAVAVATAEALQLTNVANVMVDHISTSWSSNNLVSVLDSTGVTVQWSMMADSMHSPSNTFGFGSSLRYGSGQVSLHHNLYADNYTGNPYLDENLSLDFVNNLIYNWGIHSGYSGTNDPNINFNGNTNQLNYVCNYLIAGPDTAFYSTNALQTNYAFWGGITNTWIFQTNNFIDSDTNRILNGANTDWGMFTNHFTPVSRRFDLPPVAVDEAFVAYERVLDFAGTSMAQRDTADIGIVGSVRTQTGVILSAPPGLPALSSSLLWLDSDQDGIPDFWEITFGQNPTNASQNQLSLNASYVGYTDLEEYLNWLAIPHALTVTNTSVGVDLYVMSGNSGQLSFSVTNGVNGTVYLTNVLGSVTNTGTFSNRYAIFTPTPGYAGYAAFDYYVTNNDTFGYFGPVTVSVVVSAVPPTYAVPVTALTGGVPVTNTVPPGNIAVYLVTVPANANIATNILIFATSPMRMWFDTNYPPTTNMLFLPNGIYPTGTNGSVILDTVTTTPLLVPGSTYYLLLENTNTIAVTNAIEVDFHLIFPPVLPAIPDLVVVAGNTLLVTNTATGEPTLTYTLTSTVSNAPLPTIDVNGIITWTPTTNQGPAVYTFTTVVTDGNVPQLSATNSFLVVVVLTNGLPAFPGAEGAGGFAIGGRGGDVYHVVNLNDAGPGSLRYGVQSTAGSRTIVFDVSGTITLASSLRINKPYLTIAGQTAPGDGIALKGWLTSVQKTHDVQVRFLRCRPGDFDCPVFQDDSFHFDLVTNSIADHISASWSIDEALSTTDSTNVTVQWSMIAESLKNSCHVKGPHGYGSLIRYGYGAISYHHNLYADNSSRNPRPGDNIQLDFINNVVFNWGFFAGYNADDAADNPQGYTNHLDYIGNYFIAGTNTTANPNIAFDSGVPSPDFTQIYQSGNLIDNNPFGALNGAATGTGMFTGPYTLLGTQIVLPEIPVTVTNAPQAYEQVLAFAGASLLARDRVDTNIVAGVRYKNGFIIDTEAQVGGWPVLNSAPLPLDADQDGLPDYWEITLALTGEASMNPAVPNNNHPNPDGYTDLEHYLNWLAAPHALTVTNTPVDVDLYALAGRTGNLGFSVANGTNGAVTLSNSIATFTPANGYFGFASFAFDVTNLDTANSFGPVTVSVMVSATNIVTTGSSIVLSNGVPQTNSVAANSTVFYSVTVPTNADFATNLLLFANGRLNVWFATNTPPATNSLLLPNVAYPTGTNGSVVLGTNTPPPLMPGSTYYLGVQNTNTSVVTFALEVDFHLVSGTNAAGGPIVINSITYTNLGGTNGFLLAWFAPTNDAFMVQWSGSLEPMVWGTFTNVITYAGPLTPTNGLFTFFDDGSQTGGFGPERFYRLLLVGSGAVPTNGVPQTNSVSPGNTTFLLINVPANAIAASNLLLSATGPVSVFFNQTHPPTDNTNAGDFLELSATNTGSFLLTSNSLPPLVPGASYYLGVQNPGTSNVTFAFQVNFTLAPTSAMSGFTLTTTNGGVWLKWTGQTNYQYQVQWTTNLAPAVWTTISNIVLTSATGLFTFYDDGTLAGGFGSMKFYRLIVYPYLTPIPQTLFVSSVTVTSMAGTNGLVLQWSAPTNYHYGIQWTTNLSLPFSNWTVIASPVFALTNSVYTFTDNGQTGPPTGAKYFRLLEYP